jgi:hypothetical protein
MKSQMITRRARQTKGPVTLISKQELLGDDYCGNDKWMTICEDHGHVEGHQTLENARFFASRPVSWCRWCAEEVSE